MKKLITLSMAGMALTLSACGSSDTTDAAKSVTSDAKTSASSVAAPSMSKDAPTSASSSTSAEIDTDGGLPAPSVSSNSTTSSASSNSSTSAPMKTSSQGVKTPAPVTTKDSYVPPVTDSKISVQIAGTPYSPTESGEKGPTITLRGLNKDIATKGVIVKTGNNTTFKPAALDSDTTAIWMNDHFVLGSEGVKKCSGSACPSIHAPSGATRLLVVNGASAQYVGPDSMVQFH